jgi:hypothetical protein
MNNFMQVMMPVAQGMLQAGQPDLFNGLMAAWGKVNQMDVSGFVVPPPPPPPPPPAPQEPPPPPQGQ